MSPDDRDTIPAPPPGIDPELVEAFATDVEAIADGAEGLADMMRGLVASMRKQAWEARGTK
jgi:hypothetical protein